MERTPMIMPLVDAFRGEVVLFLVVVLKICKKTALTLVGETKNEDLELMMRMVEWLSANYSCTEEFIENKMNCSRITEDVVRQRLLEFSEGALAIAESSVGTPEEVCKYLNQKGLSNITHGTLSELREAVRMINRLVRYFPLK
ncbi:hypothetical protein EXS61_01475 [Candidatus Parcubacteria bacterium]|nr:hypothetical protein [Candidatus Parcubacteria bacterium]